MNPEILYKKFILEVAVERYPIKRKRKYPLEYYLNMFYIVLEDVTKWSSLKRIKEYKSDKEYHYKTISNEYNKWTNDNIFIDANNRFTCKYYFILRGVPRNIRINTYIYITSVYNKYGIQNIGINPEYTKHNVTKMGAIVDEYKFPISIIYLDVKITNESKNNYEYVKKSFSHDIKYVQEMLDNISINIPEYTNFNLCGDKAFQTKEKFICENKEVKIITPKKKHTERMINKMINKKTKIIEDINEKMSKIVNKNSKRYLQYINRKEKINNKINELKIKPKIKYTKQELNILHKRYLVEHYFRDIKKYDRIMLRKEHNIKNFMSFVYLANVKNLVEKYYDKIKSA